MGKIVLVVNGRPRAGKDVFAKLLNDHTSVYKCSSVDKIKEIAYKCDWAGGKTEKDRKFLSDLKMLTTEYSDMAYKDIKDKVKWFKNHNRAFDVMIVDIREPEEIERAVTKFGAISVFIENNNVKNITSNMADANVENYEYDYTINNNGTINDFKEEINNFYKDITNGGK